MTSFVDAYDPAWEALFGRFQLIPDLKPRPGTPGQRRYPRSPGSKGIASAAAGMIGNSLLTQQAVVKIVRGGGVTSAGKLGGQLAYISRKGTLTTERGETGELIDGMDGLKAVQKDWARDWEQMDARTTNYTYHLIVSYPKGTDSYAAEVAAENFAHRLTGGDYGGRYKFILAHHRDTDYPHTHLIVNRAAQYGKTLHLSKYGVTTQDLRDLHVETARDVGIVLNATSRFSRNLAPEYESSARIHARRDGRDLRERPAAETRTGFPGFGRGRRTPIAPELLQSLKDQRNAEYAALGKTLRSHQAGVDQGIFTTQYPGRAETLGSYATAVLGAARTLVPDGVLKKEDIDVNQQVSHDLDPAMAAGIDTKLQAIGGDIRTFIKGMSDKADATEDEDKRSKMDAAISRVLRGYEPLMDEETRTFFGKRLERDDDGIEVGREDVDPTRQRRAAERDAADPTQTQALGQEQDRQDDPRGDATRATLKEADRKVAERFEAMGINGDLVLSRIRNGADVDRQTRERWFERDVQTLANANSLSENQARIDMKAAYKEAAEIYRDARDDIRDINRAFAEGRGDEFLKEKVGRGVQDEIEQMKGQGFDRAAIGGRLLEIEDRVHERVTGRGPDRTEGIERSEPNPRVPEDRQTNASSRVAAPVGQAPGKIDLNEGVRGRIVEAGSALYDEKDPQSGNPYVDLKIDGRDKLHRVWGVDLPDMMAREQLSIGDTATLAHDGYKTVTVRKTDLKTGEEKTIEARRRAWKATDIERAPREEQRGLEPAKEAAHIQRDATVGRNRAPEQKDRAAKQEVSVEAGVTGVIVDAREALVRPGDPDSKSYYVDMKVEGKDAPERIWGTALQDQMTRNNIKIGDKATFVEAGKEEVTRSRRNPETDEPERVNVTRKAWDVKNIDRQIDRDPEVQERRRLEREERARGDRGISR
ncbi:hypothetical protein RA27_17495 [Ruegeria sp. ANG-R]|uniref:relaxase/mobilization nuclease domain-containing protein n=1 Tax=Ruegeria sp. ANG-R TaxID=1577903 RepID=UPI00057D1F25|nr:relaxase/mobilization nuclease domain-containing protein [Ruegeria sp. ANG-R]KIC39843.1 hypothetical protein RA27_17495 [Ruegeria sp. ANG-R]